MMTPNTFPRDEAVLENLNSEMKQEFRQLQHQTAMLVLLGFAIAALLLLLLAIYTSDPIWKLGLAGLVVPFMALVWWLEKWDFRLSSFLLAAGSWGLVLSAALLSQVPDLLFLWIIGVGLATAFLGWEAGIGTVLVSAFLLLWPLPFMSFVTPSIILVTIIGMLATWSLIMLFLRPLLKAVERSWANYLVARDALEKTRDYQYRLAESLRDVSEFTSQLNRMNQIAQGLRLEAEHERRDKLEFVAKVSHELRTPLNMIIGFTDTILRSPEAYGTNIPPKLLADLQVILRNSQHLSSLVDDVLDLGQIDANQMALTKEWADFAAAVESAVTAVQPLYQSKNLDLSTDIQPDLPLVWCDEVRIREVLLNLLSNAGRFTQEGGVHVRVTLDNEFVAVTVQDTGPGITADDQKKLFQPFRQLDNSIRRKHGGTGLGLSISKAFVELHDGQIWVDSVLGQGTAFNFRIPLGPPVRSDDHYLRWFTPYRSFDDVHHIANLPAVDTRPRMMVVEQGEYMQKMLSRHFTNMDIIGSKTLEEALPILNDSGASALIVNDRQMNMMLSRLQEPNVLPYGFPAFVCDLTAQQQAINQMGVSGFLRKPVSADALLSTIAALPQAPRTILVVDDEPDARQLFRRILASADRDYRVIRANDGLHALEKLAENDIDLILLDLSMPRMDGLAFLAERQQNPAWHQIPVIVMSAQDPQREPITSSAVVATHGGGLSTRQVLGCIEAIHGVLTPLKRSGAAVANLGSLATSVRTGN
jgi:signal transduction histidine kinase/CheY-like chemotaxis protein